MRNCVQCGQEWPESKFNADCGSPDHCFKCRISTVRMGFSATRAGFHGDNLVGGTIASDNRYTVSEARANGYDPVPVATAGGVGVSTSELARLKKHSTFARSKD